ncbi:MAG: hypothetical protein ACYDBQ_07485 [Thermoplasmatota archaeon]
MSDVWTVLLPLLGVVAGALGSWIVGRALSRTNRRQVEIDDLWAKMHEDGTRIAVLETKRELILLWGPHP